MVNGGAAATAVPTRRGKCEALERKARQDREGAAFNHYLDRDEEYERATGEEQMRRDDRVMGR